MTSYIEHSVNLTDNQKMNLAKSIKNKCPLTLRIKYSDLARDVYRKTNKKKERKQ